MGSKYLLNIDDYNANRSRLYSEYKTLDEDCSLSKEECCTLLDIAVTLLDENPDIFRNLSGVLYKPCKYTQFMFLYKPEDNCSFDFYNLLSKVYGKGIVNCVNAFLLFPLEYSYLGTQKQELENLPEPITTEINEDNEATGYLDVSELEPQELYLVHTKNGRDLERFKISEEKSIVGRGSVANFKIVVEGVSREHCIVFKSGNSFFITDLGSTNGTYVDGIKLQPNIQREIYSGEYIKISTEVFKVST